MTDSSPPNLDHVARMVATTCDWFSQHHRDLPWRRADCPAWGVLVSEVMLQQTPVARVEPVWREWMTRWPMPGLLAAEPQAEAVRAWGRLGYPRRAARLHATATALTRDHGGQVPRDEQTLRTLPGIGEYTAAAVAAFAYNQPTVVVDTNVRRVLMRAFGAQEHAGATYTAQQRRLAHQVATHDPSLTTAWGAASMELGAVVCTARAPKCERCPIAQSCAWRAAGYPRSELPRGPSQKYYGTDRYVRGLVLAMLREEKTEVPAARVDLVWHDHEQLRRALRSLTDDALISGDGRTWCLA